MIELVIIGAVGAPLVTRAERDRAELADLAMLKSFWSRALNSRGLLGALVLNAVAYSLFVPATPAGLVVITDAKAIARLHSEINGRYGTPGATELVLANGELAGWTERTNTSESRKIFALGYRCARRDNSVVLLASNGAELRIESGRRLLFYEQRLPAERCVKRGLGGRRGSRARRVVFLVAPEHLTTRLKESDPAERCSALPRWW